MDKLKARLKKAWDEIPATIKVAGAITITSTTAALYYRHKLDRLKVEGAIFSRDAIEFMKAGCILEHKIKDGKLYHRIIRPRESE